MRQRSHRLLVALAAVTSLALGACASAPDTVPSEAEVDAKVAEANLGAMHHRAMKVVEDTKVLESRISSALSAVNWSLRHYPECTDTLFDKVASLDLKRRQLGEDAMAIAEQLEAAMAGKGPALDVLAATALDNRITHIDDEVTMLNAELATLFGKIMKRGRPCEVEPGKTPDGRKVEEL